MMMAGGWGGGASCEWLKGLSQELCYGWVGESGGGLEGGCRWGGGKNDPSSLRSRGRGAAGLTRACPNTATGAEGLIGMEGQQIDGDAGLMDGGMVGREGACVCVCGGRAGC